jgi:flavin reductase (DIM6/NTAB) family NADH-FMN oxidoreductase RutF
VVRSAPSCPLALTAWSRLPSYGWLLLLRDAQPDSVMAGGLCVVARRPWSLPRRRPPFRTHTTDARTSTDADALKRDLRALFRESAQPVAVVTARLDGVDDTARFHGATLSSFAPVALDPHALVAFALRVPSRMARALAAARARDPRGERAHLVVNVLGGTQASLAARFAAADPAARPFEGCPHAFTPDGLPVLDGVLGALSCTLVAPPLPLHDLHALSLARPTDSPWTGDAASSELFVARVTRVERVPQEDAHADDPATLPLLYHRRGYTTTAVPVRPP